MRNLKQLRPGEAAFTPDDSQMRLQCQEIVSVGKQRQYVRNLSVALAAGNNHVVGLAGIL